MLPPNPKASSEADAQEIALDARRLPASDPSVQSMPCPPVDAFVRAPTASSDVQRSARGGRNRGPAGLMKIGELARRTGKTVRALHLYEELGLLHSQRSEGGFRLYGEAEYARVAWICKLQDMGFKLAQIRGLLDSVRRSDTAPGAMDSVRIMFHEKLRETRKQVEILLQLERDIAESMAYLEACRSCAEQSTRACATCDSSRHSLPEPALVAGIHLAANLNPKPPAPTT